MTRKRQDRFRECQVGEARVNRSQRVVLMYGESFVLSFASPDYSTCPRNVRFLLPPRLFVVLPRAAPLWHCGGLVICLYVGKAEHLHSENELHHQPRRHIYMRNIDCLLSRLFLMLFRIIYHNKNYKH